MREHKTRLKALGLHGLAARIEELQGEEWLDKLLDIEEAERSRRSFERRTRDARVGKFKDMGRFDWKWPTKIDRSVVEALFRLDFLAEGANVVLLGPNGVGKSMIAKNITHAALAAGRSARFVTAAAMLTELATQGGGRSLDLALAKYARPSLLAIDEVGYLSYDARHADLLFEVVSRRYDQERSLIITTNKVFGDWAEVFPNASSVVALVDRVVHRAEVVAIEGESYRLKEAEERARARRVK